MYNHGSLSAVNPMDYLQLNSTLSFATCQKRHCMNVIIVNDMVDEPEEFFNYTLERTPGLDTRILLAPIDGQISISDDHGKLFNVCSKSDYHNSPIHSPCILFAMSECMCTWLFIPQVCIVLH